MGWELFRTDYFSDITRELLRKAGATLNLTQGTADRLLDHLIQRIVPETEALYAEVEVENARLIAARPELGVTLTGESRCLRTILHTVIKEMVRQLG